MNKFLILLTVCLFSACSTKYILMDENENPVEKGYYSDELNLGGGNDFYEYQNGYTTRSVYGDSASYRIAERPITADDVFVVEEGAQHVVYQYKNVRVDEVSPLATLYCADIANGASAYLRGVERYHNGFMRATFDCVYLAN